MSSSGWLMSAARRIRETAFSKISDSMILSLAGENFEDSIPSSALAYYEETKDAWFETPYTKKVPGRKKYYMYCVPIYKKVF